MTRVTSLRALTVFLLVVVCCVSSRSFQTMEPPNFINQEKSVFYGWINSQTSLQCIANGSPPPLIQWYRGEKNLARVAGYVISMGNSGLPTRTISYLTPTVDINNVDSVFGEYRCVAENRLGTSHQDLTFQRAVVPEGVKVNVIDSKATVMILRISPPANDGGQPVTKYVIKYSRADNADDPVVTRDITRFAQEEVTQVTLSNLEPKTSYSIRLYAVNNVGTGQEKKLIETTKEQKGGQ